MSVAKRWEESRTALVVAECGTGKTLISLSAVHVHSEGKPYKAIGDIQPTRVDVNARRKATICRLGHTATQHSFLLQQRRMEFITYVVTFVPQTFRLRRNELFRVMRLRTKPPDERCGWQEAILRKSALETTS
jgi:hypothetical protein